MADKIMVEMTPEEYECHKGAVEFFKRQDEIYQALLREADDYREASNARLTAQNQRLAEKLKAAISVNNQLKEHNKTYLREIAQLQAKVSVMEHQQSILKSEFPFYIFMAFLVGAMTGLIVKLFMF